MTDPLSYQSDSARHNLPLLFAAQVQKEIVLNEALMRIDSLLHLSVEDRLAAPPVAPEEGQCWLVAAGAGGTWAGHEDQIAAFSGADWLFSAPREGMRCWLQSTGQWLRFGAGWVAPEKPVLASGGATVDAESRTAIEALINALTEAGIFST
ncbi:DUF2793 domain-containing protein [Erythrobacter sp. SDW2]|uniref:DUF2793 domain-containing protein n=1 Tax=Erythrobacter sp. SDW2 TaxID=2907154 RepID=UPI001F261160|nr:DUF2793 domain-containing protein [Erythrobacter sp. SDW2]UIP07145.1 DUF2793 domain-containing protein [Erythrobacter sp. SDW2]